LCTAEIDGVAMSTSDIVALSINILLAATEPADKTLALLFHHLIDHPDRMAEVAENPILLTDALAETLRYTSPVQLIPRQTTAEVTIADIRLAAGTDLFCMIGAANRDPRRFERPDTFDIHRTDLGGKRSFTGAAHHLAFGSGMHFCVGAAFARMQLEVAAAELLPVLRHAAHAPGFEYREAGIYTRGPISLEVTL
jgi:pulcherriminic acid synthase